MAVLFYTANEGISVTENIVLFGVHLPPDILDALKKLKDNTENKMLG
ncbi:phage holin family protein [Alkaliphilus sp. B6464]|nr:phage holin family protein [Alkaliphilus sp. B6464]QUH19964.1 phage holin family protein [Alkaliphilus sp. B6464]